MGARTSQEKRKTDSTNTKQPSRKEAIMLGFGSSNGVEIKGKYAQRMCARAERVRSGKLNKYDQELVRFQNQKGDVALVRDF